MNHFQSHIRSLNHAGRPWDKYQLWLLSGSFWLLYRRCGPSMVQNGKKLSIHTFQWFYSLIQIEHLRTAWMKWKLFTNSRNEMDASDKIETQVKRYVNNEVNDWELKATKMLAAHIRPLRAMYAPEIFSFEFLTMLIRLRIPKNNSKHRDLQHSNMHMQFISIGPTFHTFAHVFALLSLMCISNDKTTSKICVHVSQSELRCWFLLFIFILSVHVFKMHWVVYLSII